MKAKEISQEDIDKKLEKMGFIYDKEKKAYIGSKGVDIIIDENGNETRIIR